MSQIIRPLFAGSAEARHDFGALLRNGPPARTVVEEREHRKRMLAAAFRLLARLASAKGRRGASRPSTRTSPTSSE